jgi:hypothetical protein
MTIGLVSALAKDHKPDDIIAVSYRLGALAKFIEEGHAGKWAIPVLHADYKLVNEALFRAAASAPLMEAKTVGDVTFDPNAFHEAVLKVSETEGNA